MFSDVPFVPVSRKMTKEVVKVLDIKNEDSILEIGSGDGRFLLYASKRYPNTKFVGIEINSFLVLISNLKKRILRRNNLEFLKEDALNFDRYNKFNKIFLYMYDGFTKKLVNKYENVFEKNTILVSNIFGFGKVFESSHKVVEYPVKYINKKEKIYIWKK